MAAAKKSRIGPRLQQHRFPAKAIKGLSDIHEREIEDPDRCPSREKNPAIVAEHAGDHRARERDADPGTDREGRVRRKKEKETWRLFHRHFAYEDRDRQQRTFARQRFELVEDVQERNKKERP